MRRLNVGDLIKADAFAAGDSVDVAGTSKGKGYAGAIKRWNFHRLKETHGTGPVAPPRRFHGRLLRPLPRHARARRWPAIMGAERVTVQNLDRRQGGRREQPHRHQGRDPRPQGRHRRDHRQRQESVREGGITMPKVTVFDMAGQAGRRDGAFRRRVRHRAQRGRHARGGCRTIWPTSARAPSPP